MFETRKGTTPCATTIQYFMRFKLVPWAVLDRLVEELRTNKKVRRLTTRFHGVAVRAIRWQREPRGD